MKNIQIFLTPAAGKRLIAKAIAAREDVQDAVMNHTVVVIKGTTNAYLAEELLTGIGVTDFDKRGFYRGVVKSPDAKSAVPVQEHDVVIEKGKYVTGKTIFDVVGDLRNGDMIFKGANAVNLEEGTAGILIGDPMSGTVGAAHNASVGKRVQLIHPVGVEKRVDLPMKELAEICNDPEGKGPGLFVSTGAIYTEIEALYDLCGVDAYILAAGGVAGCEGGCFFVCEGEDDELEMCREVVKLVAGTPPYEI